MTKQEQEWADFQTENAVGLVEMNQTVEDNVHLEMGYRINPEWEKTPWAEALVFEEGSSQRLVETGRRFSRATFAKEFLIPKWIK